MSNKVRKVQAVIYARISVDRANETSIENQEREMREWCNSQGWEIVGAFHDRGKSAFKLDTEREGFDAAMAMIETGQANHLVVWKLDRMTRNARGWVKINERLEDAKATFASKSETWFDTTNPMGYALVLLMAALAEIEAQGIQERARSWYDGRNGKLLPPVGNRPFGYLRPNPNELAHHPTEAPLVAEMAERVLGGESMRSIARDLTERGVPTPQRKSARNRADQWTHSTVRSILTSPTTAAMVKVGDRLIRSDKWEPLLPESMWRDLLELVNDPSRSNPVNGIAMGPKVKYLLPNLMDCGKCAAPMVTDSHTTGRRYKCSQCSLSIDAQTAELTVTQWVSTIPQTKWESMLTQGRGADQRVVEAIQARIDEMFIEYATNPTRVSKATYDATMRTLEAQLAAAQSEPALKLPNVPNLSLGWASMSNNDRRLVIKACTESIVVLPYKRGQLGRHRILVNGEVVPA